MIRECSGCIAIETAYVPCSEPTGIKAHCAFAMVLHEQPASQSLPVFHSNPFNCPSQSPCSSSSSSSPSPFLPLRRLLSPSSLRRMLSPLTLTARPRPTASSASKRMTTARSGPTALARFHPLL
ncbi:hypothetical protein L226DRAFT_613133 [Lentinus tigrinus ALCF2SS1-7]|uniref:uncharacterized protein n=1 Tax=Lentinus tigrinus ALCF2SS1-7 TaxID=1328758 RepID=UPI001166365E|nr:hypothetical protein L226DRAFT_613133 [Lentinus tigrinus ALCF2SS1-7]